MKVKSLVLIIIAVMLFGMAAYYISGQKVSEQEMLDHSMEQAAPSKTAIDIIHQRKSVRHYTDQKVTDNDLQTLVKAGMAAPTSKNRQPWAFFIIEDSAKLKELAHTLPKNGQMLETCSAAIIVCGDLKKAKLEPYEDYWMIDCAMASQNILLAAEELGLGAVFTAAYPYPERVAPVRTALNLPENLRPLSIIPVGYPTGEDKAKDKWNPNNLYYNTYE